MRTPDDLTRLINQSGFPLQMALAHMVDTHANSLGWKVLYKEHGWRSTDGQTGFIDLVLEDRWGSSVLALECKRVLDSEWLFLSDSGDGHPSRRSRLWVTNTVNHGKEQYGYFDAESQPESQESMFCVVAGQDAKSRPMLERVAADITAATEALAIEEHPLIERRGFGVRMYASVIVTTARLVLSRVNASEINLATGEVAEATHEEIPWIRFRKHFSSERAVELTNPDWDFSSVATAKEKLVFVVSVTAIDGFLRKWAVVSDSLRTLW